MTTGIGRRPGSPQLVWWGVATLLLATLAPPAAAQAPGSGVLEWNAYRDTRGFSTMTSAVGLGLTPRLTYFAFTNHFDGLGADDATDLTTFYSEQNLRLRMGSSPFDATAQWVLRSGEANDLLRLGVRWRLQATPGLADLFSRLRLGWAVNLHAVQLEHGSPNGFRTQIEHVYRWVLIPGLHELSLSGFLDQNLAFDDDDSSHTSRIVSEHQAAVRLFDHLHAVAEFRWNQYMAAGFGVGFGVQYRRAFGG